MDLDPPSSSSIPTLRSQKQILQEEFGTLDSAHVFNEIITWQSFLRVPPTETWTTLKLPYQAPNCPHLPSLGQILEVNEQHGLRKNNGLHDVCKIGDTIIKLSADPNIVEEAENLLFVAENLPQLRVPTVLAVWEALSEVNTVVYCLMMNYIEGFTLRHEEMAKFPEKALDIICAKVSAQIRDLRSLPSEGYYGRVHRQGWLHPPSGILPTPTPVLSVSGTYSTYQEFTSAIYRSYEWHKAVGVCMEEFPPGYASRVAELWSIFSGWESHELKFTWIDLKIENMVVRPVKDDARNKDWEVFLIDWECAGWYPAWVQSMQFYQRCHVKIRDQTQLDKYGKHPFVFYYRNAEIERLMIKDFDPNPDRERLHKTTEND
ncbi:hypothetical protein BU23DRAFT_563087 [Bimuria novae-zelandiae CBS 107.79]|uniref:Aminoglycoside phosphotransferase domain-containing protein n=1 Tax=Bimuria novae-zelandiae CBS 107.79 TaxID=1447943 RepID=A0A6A5VPV5_9PLEO|nr:hypothetical protein BU23DRAFT_563087 [Bimuria novae-zelandiae CBS 107.79]